MTIFNEELLKLQIEEFCEKNENIVLKEVTDVIEQVMRRTYLSCGLRELPENDILAFHKHVDNLINEYNKKDEVSIYRLYSDNDIFYYIPFDKPELVKKAMQRMIKSEMEDDHFSSSFSVKSCIIKMKEDNLSEIKYDLIETEDDLDKII